MNDVMSRRYKHQLTLWLVTIPWIFGGLTYAIIHSRYWPLLLWVGGGYIAFLLGFRLWAQLSTPAEQRVREPLPFDWKLMRLGQLNEAHRQLLSKMSRIAERETKGMLGRTKIINELYQSSFAFPNGTWEVKMEVRGEELVGYAGAYQSRYSPFLDKGLWSHSGRKSVFFE